MLIRFLALVHNLQTRIGNPGTVRRRFVTAVVWNLIASIGSRSLVLLAAVGCARFLGKSGFGQFGIVQNTANLASAVAALGLGITATQYIADLRQRDPERTGRIIGLTWMITAISGVIATIACLFAARPIAVSMIHAPELTNCVRIASSMIFLNALLAYQNGALCGFEAFRGLARVNVITGVLSLPVVLFGVWRSGVTGAVVGTAISLAINWVFNERLLLRECRTAGIAIQIWQSFQETAVFWEFSLPALLGSLATAPVLWYCSILIVRLPHGFEQMGLYSAADRWRIAILFIPTALFRSVLPLLANLHKQDPASYRRVERAHLLINLLVVVLPVMAIACLSAPIMSVYGTGFRAGWPVLALFCLGTIPEALNTILGFPLVTGGRMWVRCGFDLALSAILLLLAMWLIPIYGALGFAIAYLATCSTISAGLYLVTREHRNLASSESAVASQAT